MSTYGVNRAMQEFDARLDRLLNPPVIHDWDDDDDDYAEEDDDLYADDFDADDADDADHGAYDAEDAASA